MTTATQARDYSRTAIRKAVGQGKFVAQDFANAYGLTGVGARLRLTALVEAGDVEMLDEKRLNLDEEGNTMRGRPAFVYRVAKGKAG